MTTQLENINIEKGISHIIVHIIEYVPNAIKSKTIIKKTSGDVTVTSVAAGEELEYKTCPYDIYIQIIDGAAELNINGKDYLLHLGDGIIIPANTKHCFSANVQFKMLSTVIKSISNN